MFPAMKTFDSSDSRKSIPLLPSFSLAYDLDSNDVFRLAERMQRETAAIAPTRTRLDRQS